MLCCALLPKKTLSPLILQLSNICTLKKAKSGSRLSLCFCMGYISNGEKRIKLQLKMLQTSIFQIIHIQMKRSSLQNLFFLFPPAILRLINRPSEFPVALQIIYRCCDKNHAYVQSLVFCIVPLLEHHISCYTFFKKNLNSKFCLFKFFFSNF